MSLLRRCLSVAWTLALAGALAACSGSASVTEPTAAPLASGTAAISGLVQGGVAVTGDVHAQSFPGLKVSALGTPAVTVTDGEGRFVLAGLPAGEVTLHFEGSGADARLVVAGLQDGQTVSLTVEVQGREARVVPHPQPAPPKEAHVRGKVESVSPLRVAGTRVRVDGNTHWSWSDGTGMKQSELQVGQKAEVVGTREADGSLRAQRFTVDCNS
jgi:hypothetical protein